MNTWYMFCKNKVVSGLVYKKPKKHSCYSEKLDDTNILFIIN